MCVMSDTALAAINAAFHGQRVFCKFLSANDTGKTGGHQAGIYISKPSIPILFNEPGMRGTNKDRYVNIKWHNDFSTNSRFIYYGIATRDEYRITRFGRDFPFLSSEYTGALFILIQDTEDNYQGFILNTDDEINQFLDMCGLSPTETNRLIEMQRTTPEEQERLEFSRFLSELETDFPSSEHMSAAARRIQDAVFNHKELIQKNPDQKLLDWTNIEFRLFRFLEYARYGDIIRNGFSSLDDFLTTASQILNRRKSRAGKSLEHHLAAIFDGNLITYEAQAITEGNKKPDFLFPSQEAYHDMSFSTEKLVSLAAKTTCKDRWRQVINEADRLRGRSKFLCTLQQGISAAQIDEMEREQVVLVVPEPYIKTYPKERRERIWTLRKFVQYVKSM